VTLRALLDSDYEFLSVRGRSYRTVCRGCSDAILLRPVLVPQDCKSGRRHAKNVPPYLAVDCAIVDQFFCGKLQVVAGGGIVNTHYTTNASEIDRRIGKFEELKSLARAFKE